MQNYAKGKPVGDNMVPFFDSPPAVKSLGAVYRDNAVASSILILTHNTTAIEVAADGHMAHILWLSQSTVDSSVAGTSVLTAVAGSFDNTVPDGEVRRFIVPVNAVATAEGYGSILGDNRENGLFTHVAIKSGGNASVATTQYGKSNSY